MSARAVHVATAAPTTTLPFDVVEAKIRPPERRAEDVSRTPLVNRLRVARSVRVATVVAPAGYGKSTLLEQWSRKDGRPFAWLRIDERDNDPIVFLRHLGAALDAIEPLAPPVVEALCAPGRSVWTAVVPRLTAALASPERRRCVVVLDDAHLLHSDDSAEVLATLPAHVLDGSMLVVAGRTPPPLPIAGLRANGRLLELGVSELALNQRESERLLRTSGVELTERETDEILCRTEGWAAGLYLAALAFRDARGAYAEPGSFRGDDRYIAEYLRSEHLADLAPELLAFLRRTSLLRRMSVPLCDAVLGRNDSARELGRLEGSGFLVPLDRRGEWYRWHRLVQDVLRRELTRTEPELVEALHERAADWLEAHDDPGAAIEHAWEAEDLERVATLLATHALPLYESGRASAVVQWLDRFDGRGLVDQYPLVGVVAAWVFAFQGRPADAERMLHAAERSAGEVAPPDGSASVEAWSRVVRAALCRAGADTMCSELEAALPDLAPNSPWRANALLLQGVASLLQGDVSHADEELAAAADLAAGLGATTIRLAALAERALIAFEQQDHAAAERLAFEACDLLALDRVDRDARVDLARAVCVRALLRCGHWEEAGRELASARLSVGALESAPAWLGAQTLLELARVNVAVRDGATAESLLAGVNRMLASGARLDPLVAQADKLSSLVGDMSPGCGSVSSGLTAAELRLLPLLATHMSFREIGERLFVSRNTVKTQAISVYRKLGVSSRSEAIDHAARLGLLDDPAATRAATPSSTPRQTVQVARRPATARTSAAPAAATI
jgi:LuxR family transcriptional regulator, maltose regulon positive regulatory protein